MKSIKYFFLFLLFMSLHQLGLTQTDKVFNMVEEMPRFPGCEEMNGTQKEKEVCSTNKLIEYVYKSVKYPQEAKKQKIQGRVVIQFVVGINGEISDANIVRDIGGGCGEAALEVINLMNEMESPWISGKRQGIPVKVKYTLPVSFKLPASNQELVVDEIEEVLSGQSVEDEVFKVVDEMPRFPGCEDISDKDKRSACSGDKMLKFIYRNLSYPQSARKKGIEGTAVISFKVRLDGSLTDFKLLRDPGEGCGEEAMKVLMKMNEMPEKWICGKQRGMPVIVEYVMPIKFKLRG